MENAEFIQLAELETEDTEVSNVYDEELESDIDYTEDDILHVLIELKQRMKEYVETRGLPLLNKFDMEVWMNYLKVCAEKSTP